MPRPSGGSHHSSGHRTSTSHSSHTTSTRSSISTRNSGSSNISRGSSPKPSSPPPVHRGPEQGPTGVGPRPGHMPPPPVGHGHMPPPPHGGVIHTPPPPPRTVRHVHYVRPSGSYYGGTTTVYTDSSSYSDIESEKRSVVAVVASAIIILAIIAIFVALIVSAAKHSKATSQPPAYNSGYEQSYDYNDTNQGEWEQWTSESTVPIPEVTSKVTKLPSYLCNKTDYYSKKTDNLGYFSDDVISGMKYFYEKTGVQPYVMTVDISKVNKYDDKKLEELYLDLFDDEGHFLLIIFGDKRGTVDWEYSWVIGNDAEQVINDETLDVILWYIDEYYESDMNDDELFSNAFHDAADEIMR